MSDLTVDDDFQQDELFDNEEQIRALLDGLLEDSRLYTKSEDYQNLLNLVIRETSPPSMLCCSRYKSLG